MPKLPNTFITIVTCDKPLDRHTRDIMARDVANWREDISLPLVLDEGAQLHLYNLMTGQEYSTEEVQQASSMLGEFNIPSYLVPGRDPTLTRLGISNLRCDEAAAEEYQKLHPANSGENHSAGNLLDPPLSQ